MKCSFCGKSNEEVEQMIAANDKIAICDECVMSCLEILVYGEPDPIVINLEEEGEVNDSSEADGGC